MLIIRLQKWDFVSTTIFSGIWRLLPINSIIQVINVTFLLSFRLICHAMQLCAAFQYICTFIVLLLYSAELIQIVCLVWIYFFSLIILQLLIGISHHLLCFYLNLLRFQVVFLCRVNLLSLPRWSESAQSTSWIFAFPTCFLSDFTWNYVCKCMCLCSCNMKFFTFNGKTSWEISFHKVRGGKSLVPVQTAAARQKFSWYATLQISLVPKPDFPKAATLGLLVTFALLVLSIQFFRKVVKDSADLLKVSVNIYDKWTIFWWTVNRNLSMNLTIFYQMSPFLHVIKLKKSQKTSCFVKR